MRKHFSSLVLFASTLSSLTAFAAPKDEVYDCYIFTVAGDGAESYTITEAPLEDDRRYSVRQIVESSAKGDKGTIEIRGYNAINNAGIEARVPFTLTVVPDAASASSVKTESGTQSFTCRTLKK